MVTMWFRKRWSAILLASLFAVTFVAATSAQAGAAPAPGLVISDSKSGWVSDSYLAKHPSYLNDVAVSAGVSIASLGGPVVVPMSHFGCNVNVCIDVAGQSTLVTHWYTTANGGNGQCTQSYFDQRSGGVLQYRLIGKHICAGPGSGVFYDYDTNPTGYFPNNWQLCNAWVGITGYPCATIHV